MRFVCLFGFALLAHSVFAQWQEGGGWFGLEVNQSLRKDWAWSVQYENRWDADFSRHQRGILDFAVEKDLFSKVKANLQYRYSEEHNAWGGYSPRQRLSIRLNSSGSLGKGEWNARLMGAQTLGKRTLASEMPWLEEGQSWRVRMGYQHKRKGAWRWKTDVEFFPDFEEYPENKTRFRWLLSRRLNAAMSASMGYVWSQEWGGSDPQANHILKANMTLTLNGPKKRKKASERIPDARIISAPESKSIIYSNPAVCPPDAVYVSEVHSQGEPSDWIVISNRGDSSCSLEGWRLTDSLEKLGFVFNAVVMPSKSIWKGFEKGKDSFEFGISAKGERIFWIHPEGQTQQIEVLLQEDKESQTFGFSGKSLD
jgi:hypothetical protein